MLTSFFLVWLLTILLLLIVIYRLHRAHVKRIHAFSEEVLNDLRDIKQELINLINDEELKLSILDKENEQVVQADIVDLTSNENAQ